MNDNIKRGRQGTKKLPHAMKVHFDRLVSDIEWEFYNGYYIVSPPHPYSGRIVILDNQGTQNYDVNSYGDAKNHIDNMQSTRDISSKTKEE